LNSIFAVSPIFRMSCIIWCGSFLGSFGPRRVAFFSRAFVRKLEVRTEDFLGIVL